MVGYRTYPHIDMAATGGRAAALLDRLLRERRPLHKAYRQIDFLIPLVFQCTDAEPARGVFALIDEIERGASAALRAARTTRASSRSRTRPAFRRPTSPMPGRRSSSTAMTARPPKPPPTGSPPRSRRAKPISPAASTSRTRPSPRRCVWHAGASKPIVLADIQDNPGAGGSSDTVGLLRALIAAKAEGAVIGMIVDPEAAALAAEAGEGARLDCGVGAKVGFAGETPVEADWRVARLGSGVFTGTGPMYGGASFNIGPMALVTDEASGVSAVLAAKRIQAADQEMFRHVGVEPARVPILGLKSTVHFRADFAPIAEAILCVRAPGAAISDPAELPYRHLRRGIRLRPLGPERR